MKSIFWLTGIAAVLVGIWKALESESGDTRNRYTHERHEGFTVTRERTTGGDQIVRFRGSYDDIMRSLGVIEDEKPPLPETLDIANLRSYFGGCPECGTMSMVGENMWRYQELSRTRGYMNNTTTYLARCKKCNTFMKSTVDHDD